MREITGAFHIYGVLVIIGFLLATVLSCSIPVHMNEPDDWAYYYAVKNFSRGDLVVDDTTHYQQERQARQQGGLLIQYYRIADDRWAFEKPPGYVFFLVPFELMGIPRWGNVVLALGMTIVTFILLRRLRHEKTAGIGSLLMLFTPASLIMLNRSFSDALAASAFLVMGGGLYLYHFLERDKLRPVRGAALLFLAFLFTGWSVVVRYTNLPIAAILALHFVITRSGALSREKGARLKFEIPSIILGAGLPAAALLFYNYTVFGSIFDYGYNYCPVTVQFAFQYLGAVDPAGDSVPLKIIEGNLRNVPLNLFWGYPLLIIGIPGMVFVLYQKIAVLFRRGDSTGKRAGARGGLPWDVLLILIGWFLCVFGLYMMYEFTSTPHLTSYPSIPMHQLHFIFFARFYLPGLLPLAVIVSFVLDRLPVKIWAAILVIAIIAGSILYVQSALGETLNSQLIHTPFIPRRP